jgi:dihydrofolate reductase
MAKICSNFFMSLDGVVESPDKWHFPYFNDEMGELIAGASQTTSGFLMGRRLYDEWADFWPNQADDVPFASFINAIPKYVVSHSQPTKPWNNTTLVTGDVAAQLRELKERNEGEINMSGSATLARWLLANGLLDELHLLLHPIVVGWGQRLFEDTPTTPLELVDDRRLKTGVLSLRYVPAAG